VPTALARVSCDCTSASAYRERKGACLGGTRRSRSCSRMCSASLTTCRRGRRTCSLCVADWDAGGSVVRKSASPASAWCRTPCPLFVRDSKRYSYACAARAGPGGSSSLLTHVGEAKATQHHWDGRDRWHRLASELGQGNAGDERAPQAAEPHQRITRLRHACASQDTDRAGHRTVTHQRRSTDPQTFEATNRSRARLRAGAPPSEPFSPPVSPRRSWKRPITSRGRRTAAAPAGGQSTFDDTPSIL
jgi:hypothetical protein